MIRRSSSRTLQSTDQLKAKRARRDAGTSSNEAPLTAASAGQLGIKFLNAGDLKAFGDLLVSMRQQGIHKLDFSHRPERAGTPAKPTPISELGMQCLATVFQRSAQLHIDELDFAGAHVERLEPFLQTLASVKDLGLKRMDFSGTRVLKGGKLYVMQTRHFQWIAQIVANAPVLESLALNDQPLLKGQQAGAVDAQPPYQPEATDVDVQGSLPELTNAVCAATLRYFKQLELRGCNLTDDDLSLLWPIVDTSAAIEIPLRLPRQQLTSLDLRSNPLMSYGNRLVLLGKALKPQGALQALYLPSHFEKAYKDLWHQHRSDFHERLAKSQLQVLEPLSSGQNPDFDPVKASLASHRSVVDVPVTAATEVPPFDLGRVTGVDPLSFV